MAIDPVAASIAASLPITDTDFEEDLIPLSDIVVTGIEHNSLQHFRVRAYAPDNDGSAEHPWAIIERLPAARPEATPLEGWRRPVFLTSQVMRGGVELYLDNRLRGGMSHDDARMMVDGVYTDVLVCDSIIQFILYGEEVFG